MNASNLDARLRVQMRGELKRLQHQLGTTTIYVTHDQAEAMTLAHRVAVMRKGRLQQFDSPMDVYERPANRFVAEFVGSPSMNFLEGQIDFENGKFSSEGVSLPLRAQLKPLLRTGSNQVILGVRPEHILISSHNNGDGVPARIYVTEQMGNETFVFLSISNKKLIARAEANFRAEDESEVWLSFDKAKLHFFDPVTSQRVDL